MNNRQAAVVTFLETNPDAQHKVIARACNLTVWQAKDAARRFKEACAVNSKPCMRCGVLTARPTATTYAGYCTRCMQKAVGEVTRQRNREKRLERLRMYAENKDKKATGHD